MLRLLVVDDSATIQFQLRRLLDTLLAAPHEVDTASDVAAAAKRFEETAYDLVLLDMMLLPPGNQAESSLATGPLPPRVTSLNLLRRMLQAHPEQQVAIVSALGRAHPDIIHAMSLGAVGHLEKSIDRDQLRLLLGRTLGESALAS